MNHSNHCDPCLELSDLRLVPADDHQVPPARRDTEAPHGALLGLVLDPVARVDVGGRDAAVVAAGDHLPPARRVRAGRHPAAVFDQQAHRAACQLADPRRHVITARQTLLAARRYARVVDQVVMPH